MSKRPPTSIFPSDWTVHARIPSGVYPVEFIWETDQTTIVEGSIKPFVVVGFDFYPMRPSLGINNRWETVIPVSDPMEQERLANLVLSQDLSVRNLERLLANPEAPTPSRRETAAPSAHLQDLETRAEPMRKAG